MFREDLTDSLKGRHTRLRELALLLAHRPREPYDDLWHLFRSRRRDPLSAAITRASCRPCGFPFDEHRLHKRGECRRCKGSWISEPLIALAERR
jgi:predicted Zn-ribbon and HTH transcriptional regulator